MSDKLLGPRLKLARAKQHICELDREARKFAKRKPYRLVLEAGVNPSTTFVKVRIRENIPKYFAPIVGDIIHNLRSALDLVTAAIVPGGDADQRVQFPFCKDACSLEATIKTRHIDRADVRAVDLIRQMKPYPGGNDALNGLHILDNIDKHRLLIPVLSHTGVKQFALTRDNQTLVSLSSIGLIGVEDGQILIGMPIPGNMKLGDEIEATCTIAFGNGPFVNVPIVDWLNKLARYLEDVVKGFEPFAI